MRILVVNPNTSRAMTEDIARAAALAAAPGTDVECLAPEEGPETIEGFTDEALAAPHVLELIASRREGYDGYVIACYGDPAVAACRELVDPPVVGIAEASFQLACLVAHRWSVITLLPRLRPVLEDLLVRNGMERRCASVRALSVGVGPLAPNMVELLVQESRNAIADDGAEAVLLGCAGLGPIASQMQEQLELPVLDGVSCAVALVQALHVCGLRTSKVNAFAPPRAKRFPGAAANLADVYGADA